MNTFQTNILAKHPEFTIDDFSYFVDDSQAKVKALPLDKNCSIHTMFADSLEADYHRAEYCLKNCGFKCLHYSPEND